MKIGVNKFVLLVAIIAAFSGFLFGYDSSVIADIKDQVMSQLSLSNWQWSKVVSYSLLGAVIGIPLSGLIADHLSRRTLLKIMALGFIIGSAFCAQATDINTLLVGRFLIGVCIGVASYVAPLYIAEIAPPNGRGSLILINGIAITFGQAFAYLIGFFLHDYSTSSWRILLWIGVLPAILLFLGMFFVPHSPRWLMKKHGFGQALNTLKKIRPTGANIHNELHEIEAHHHDARSTLKLLFTPPIVGVLIVGVGLGVFQQFSGINAIMYYGPVIFQSAGFTLVRHAILATFVIGLINFIFTIVTLYYVDRFGRRFLLLCGTFIAALSLFATSLLFHLNLPGQPVWVLCFLSLYVMGYCISVGSLFWVIISEIFPLRLRGLAMSIATTILWGANFIVSISFLEIYYAMGAIVIFSLLGFICFAAFAFIFYFVPETTAVSLEEIEKNLAARVKIRDIGQSVSKKKEKKEYGYLPQLRETNHEATDL